MAGEHARHEHQGHAVLSLMFLPDSYRADSGWHIDAFKRSGARASRKQAQRR